MVELQLLLVVVVREFLLLEVVVELQLLLVVVVQGSEEHTSELQSHSDLVCRLLLEKKKQRKL